MKRKSPGIELQDVTDFKDAQSSENHWYLTYADITTSLMCFFLIFFASSNTQSEQSIIDSVILSLQSDDQEKGEGLSARGKSDALVLSERDGLGEGRGGKQKANQVQSGVSDISGASSGEGVTKTKSGEGMVGFLQSAGLVAEKQGRSVLVNFSNGRFFNSSSTELTDIGKREVGKFIEMMEQYRGKIFIEIQGHTDIKPVRQHVHKRFKNNTELSALRAISVFNMFKESGFSTGHLAISGFGASNPTVFDSNAAQRDLSKDRRVSFRITERQP